MHRAEEGQACPLLPGAHSLVRILQLGLVKQLVISPMIHKSVLSALLSVVSVLQKSGEASARVGLNGWNLGGDEPDSPGSEEACGNRGSELKQGRDAQGSVWGDRRQPARAAGGQAWDSACRRQLSNEFSLLLEKDDKGSERWLLGSEPSPGLQDAVLSGPLCHSALRW